MLNVKDIRLSQEELARCIAFARDSAPNQQTIEFGDHETKSRQLNEVARDNLIGKIAEAAFHKMMKANYGLDVALDFNLYPRGRWDAQDAVINGWRIDVKGTRKGGHWMLIEWNKLQFRQKEDKLSHVYVMFSVEWDRSADLPTGRVSYEGAASLNRLRPDCKTTRVLHKGESIPGTHTVLQADNYGIHFRNLYKHLNHLTAYLLEHEPPASLTENYPNPFTGKTTAQVLASAEEKGSYGTLKGTEPGTMQTTAAGAICRLKKFFFG